jgi:hypothetical protein
MLIENGVSQDFFKYCSKKDDLYSFYGELNHTNITLLLKSIKKAITGKVNKGLFKKMYTVINESLENIVNHSERQDCKMSFINIEQVQEKLIIKIVSPIRIADSELLNQKVLAIKKLNETELKEFYFNSIVNTESVKNTAGLGLIQIAMITKNNFFVSFRNHETRELLYELTLELNT